MELLDTTATTSAAFDLASAHTAEHSISDGVQVARPAPHKNVSFHSQSLTITDVKKVQIIIKKRLKNQ